MALSNRVLQRTLRMIIKNEHYRKIAVDQITVEFLEFTVRFFKDIVVAKLDGATIDIGWYKNYFLDGSHSSTDTMIYGGLNKKTVENIYGSSARRVVFDVTPRHFDELIERVEALVADESPDLEIELTIKFRDVSVQLSLSETLVVVNVLGVKRSQIRGGAWSRLGKRLELPLMLTLAKLYSVPSNSYASKGLTGESREVDFHFISQTGISYYCEVKLMGKGNPESADSAIARDSNIFIADTLSEANKTQLARRNRHWIELRQQDGFRKMYQILNYLDIPCADFTGDLDEALDRIIPQVFEEIA